MPLPARYTQTKLMLQCLCLIFLPRSKFFFKIAIAIISSFTPLCTFESDSFAYLPGCWKRVSLLGRRCSHLLQAYARCPLPVCGWWVFENKTVVTGGEGARTEELGRHCIAEQNCFVCFLSFQVHSSLCNSLATNCSSFLSDASMFVD